MAAPVARRRNPEDISVLIGCECSGRVRDAFLALGFDAWSCDLQPCETGSNRHMQDDIRYVLDFGNWDLMAVFHPPCTRLANSGVRWLKKPPPGRTLEELWAELEEGAALFSHVWNADVPHKMVENPIMHRHAKARIDNYQPPAQTIQPWWFGDEAFKGTSLWLNDLPKLVDTNRLTPPATGTDEHKRWSAIHRAPPGPERAKIRSRTFPGIANAIATQWGDFLIHGSQPMMSAQQGQIALAL